MIGPITDFPHLLAQVSPHMGTDGTLPRLCGVYFEADARYLYAMASDRYTLAVARRPLEKGATARERMFVTADDLKSVRAFTKLTRREPVSLEVRSRHDLFAPRLALVSEGMTLEVPCDATEFPSKNWRQRVTEALSAPADLRRPIRINPGMLARWGKAAVNDPLVMWSAGPARPIVVACGADFIGIQMPIRSGTGADRVQGEVRDAWGDYFGYTAPAASVA